MVRSYKNYLSLMAVRITAVVSVCAFLVLTTGCDSANFSGGAARGAMKPKTKPKPKTNTPTSLDMEFAGEKKIEAEQNSRIWTATTNGVIKRLEIENDKITDEKMWLGGGGGSGGMRSYVTEGGFLGARFPNLYFIDPNKPLVVLSKNIGATSRVCVVSYMKDGKRFIIAGWGSGEFIEYPMDDKPPYAPLWNGAPSKRGKINMVGNWGYSCFIDQQQKIFYSQWSTMAGLDLKTYQAANINTTAPNATFRSTTPGVSAYSMGTAKTSYAMSGDSYGNVYNGTGYTSAYDKSSDSVWFSSGNQIVVIDRKCLTIDRNCTNFTSYTPIAGSRVGPMSPLRDGRIVGLVRHTGDIYLMRLKDKTNLKSGIEAVRIGNAGGDPYMYTDFTGATLYINQSEQTFKPTEMAKYDSKKAIKAAVFKWIPTTASSAGALSVPWKSLKLEARCYSNAQSKPAYEDVGTVFSSDQGTPLEVGSCREGKYEFVDVKLTQLNNESTMLGIESISVGFKQ